MTEYDKSLIYLRHNKTKHMLFSEILNSIMKVKGWNTSKLSEVIGKSTSLTSKYVRGINTPINTEVIIKRLEDAGVDFSVYIEDQEIEIPISLVIRVAKKNNALALKDSV